MANTTNFGWETPDDTDLVKDGAAAMRTLGNAIDTSFVDLKGGTTGQILSKASNTDLDYTWVSPNPGDITSVAAGTGLTGGGTSGDVTVSIDPTYYLLANQTRRNPILNSNFSVWQRGTSVSLAAGTLPGSSYTADRFQMPTNANQACTVSRQLTNDNTNLPFIQYCARFQRNSGQTGTGNLNPSYSFESIDSRQFAGKTVTFSFYARKGADFSGTSSNIYPIVAYGTGTDQTIQNGFTGQTTFISATTTLTTTWQRFTYSGTVASSATQLGFYFNWAPTGTAGTNDYFEITGIQLEIGSTATDYRPNGQTYQAELAACQRYYYRISATTQSNTRFTTFFPANSATTAYLANPHPVPMRVIPTSVDYANLVTYDNVTVGNAITLTVDTTNSNTIINSCVVTSTGMTQYRNYTVLGNGTSAYMGFSAEL